MSYYVRALCTSDAVPPLRHVLDWTAANGVALAPTEATVDLDTEGWRETALLYKPERLPLVVEVNRAADRDRIVAEEVEELVELLEDVEDSPEKRRVTTHLRNVRVIVAVQLLSDIDDYGREALRSLLAYFVEHCGGLVHADDEGFHEGDELLLDTQ